VLDGVSLLPAAGLQYAHLFEGGYSEGGASGFDLAVSSRNADSLRPFLGASAAQAFTTEDGLVLIPEADISYSHEMFNTPPSLVQVGGGSFTVDGLVPSRDEVTVGGGVSAKISDRLAFYADYHAVLPTGNLFQQTVSAGLSYKF
jgi:fibronectin-binding autotransporter adhesin